MDVAETFEDEIETKIEATTKNTPLTSKLRLAYHCSHLCEPLNFTSEY